MKASTWERFDKAGTAVSLTCAVHCVAFPFLVGFAPLLAGSFLWGEAFEETMAACSLIIATPALARGYLRHRRPWVPLAFVVGVVFMLALAHFAFGQTTFPVNGTHNVKNIYYAFINATIITQSKILILVYM